MIRARIPNLPRANYTQIHRIPTTDTAPSTRLPPIHHLRPTPAAEACVRLHSTQPTRFQPLRTTAIRPNQLVRLSPATSSPPRSLSFSLARSFHSTRPRKDIIFVTIPAIKQALLTLTRITLIALPFAWRWKLFKRFPTASRTLWQIPIIAFCLVLALGLNQSPKTARWRLLLMSEREELEWSNQRFDELLSTEAMSIVPPDDARVKIVQSVCTRLIQALQDESPVSCANFPREEIVERLRDAAKRRMIVPSARTEASIMPFLPETSNPEKLMPVASWDIFVIDEPKINAFVLPSTDIFVYTGLLALVEDDEALLASVIAHEISHVTERHSVESLGFLALSGVAFDVLRGASWALTLSFPVVGDALAACFNFLDKRVGRLAYSRKLETEADALGLELMARAGFDPRAALQLWEILNEVELDVQESGDITEHIALLRTHPTGESRLQARHPFPAPIRFDAHANAAPPILQAIKNLLPAAMAIYNEVQAAQTAMADKVAQAKVNQAKRDSVKEVKA